MNSDVTGSNRTALVTGASGGIGYELSNCFAADGYDVVLVARREQRLMEVADELADHHGVEGYVVSKDLTEPDAPREVRDAVDSEELTIDALVNNAGIGAYGKFHEQDVADALRVISLNIEALTHLTGLFLPEMVDRGHGKVLNMASSSAFSPGPYTAAYSASKAYVLHFSEAIAEEVREEDVTVTAYCPGHTDTNFLARMGVEESPELNQSASTPADVAQVGYDGLMRGETVVFADRKEAFKASVSQLLPRRVVRRISMRNEESRDRNVVERTDKQAEAQSSNTHR